MVTLLNPARLSAARMASNSVGGSTTSTVHITVSRRLLPRRKNRFPSSGNPASAKARVTACVSAVSTAIRYRIDAGSLVARAQSLFSVGRSLSTDGAAVKLAQTLLSCLRRHLLALAARDDVGVRSEVCIRVPEPRADYFQWHSILQLQRRVRVQQSIRLEQRLEPGLLLSSNL